MDNGGPRANGTEAGGTAPKGSQVPSEALPPTKIAPRHTSDGEAWPDPTEFFRNEPTHVAGASYAKTQARNHETPSLVQEWARAANLNRAPWAILPVAIAGAFIWAQNLRPQLERLVVVALAALAMIIAVNLLRGAVRELRGQRISIAALLGLHSTKAAIGVFASGVVLGLVVARWASPGALALAAFGLVLSIGYALLPAMLGAIPGDELIPAFALGPVLFFVSLSTQVLTRTTSTTPSTTVAVNLMTPQAWMIALGLGLLYFAAIIASRFRGPEPHDGVATRSLIGLSGLRALFILALLGAYALVVGAGIAHDAPHASIIVLLSLPIAILPLTGALRASTPAALAVITPQIHRLVISFSLWLLGGLLLAGVYLRFLMTLKGLK